MLLKFLTKLFNKEVRKWKPLVKINLLLTVKPIYFSNPFGITFILRLNLLNSWIIRRESWFFRLWNTTGFWWFNVTLMLQSIFAGPLYFPVMWQWPLTLSKDAFYNFINSMIEESKYCSVTMKKYFNKELVMT